MKVSITVELDITDKEHLDETVEKLHALLKLYPELRQAVEMVDVKHQWEQATEANRFNR